MWWIWREITVLKNTELSMSRLSDYHSRQCGCHREEKATKTWGATKKKQLPTKRSSFSIFLFTLSLSLPLSLSLSCFLLYWSLPETERWALLWEPFGASQKSLSASFPTARINPGSSSSRRPAPPHRAGTTSRRPLESQNTEAHNNPVIRMNRC